jgi:CheY-like chemotaxis protein
VCDSLEAYDFLFATGTYAARRAKPLPRLVFMSMSQLTRTGTELLDLMRTYSRTRRIPIVLLASSVECAPLLDRVKLLKLGINSYIVKSETAEAFVRAITAATNYWLKVDQFSNLTLMDVPLPNNDKREDIQGMTQQSDLRQRS